MFRVLAATVALCWSLKTSREGETCAPLKNHGSYSAVEIGIGTPRQSFDLVADTGSSNVIVTHCACQQTNCFGYSTPCFTGANRSSTFHIPLGEDGEPESLALEFGSGVIFGVLGTDVVSLGSTAAVMNRSLVLMYDHELDASITDFEGIFGLGLPYDDVGFEKSSWLTTAAIDRFSMCFTGFEEDGVLRLNYGEAKESKMKSVGKYHWGLNFNGISIGQETQEVLFCDGQTASSRCGIIPDSGTTLMLGPSQQILELFSSLCDMWPRCQKAYAEFNRTQKDEFTLGGALGDWLKHALSKWGLPTISSPFAPDPKTQVKLDKRRHFEGLLKSCQSWGASDTAALDKELPTIYWHLAGAEGEKQILEMPPSSYVVAMGYAEQVACLPFFGEYEYVTAQNGPIWILGSAVFYDYVVQYDLSSSSISFSDSPCGHCAGAPSAVSGVPLLKLARKRRGNGQRLRRQEGKVRMPHWDTQRPL
ncbi:unnamed protein product [Cladocopium goreaui]|uniref:Aspartic proteinase A1 n=1 Tax=Cladocopium goreaui TaxID=2562237 RepID=A0A9P1FL43_9DINO|nr:unnamed protein product [Cladocopium goreaui]